MTFSARGSTVSRSLVCALDPPPSLAYRGAVRRPKTWAWAAAAAATLAICIATLHSGGGSTLSGWSFYLTSCDAALAELIANLILFIPLGITLTLSGLKPMRVIAARALLSFTVEFLQQWIPGRDPSLGDIIASRKGTAFGFLLVSAAPIWLFAPPRRSAWQALGTAIVALLVWYGAAAMVRQSFPPLPYTVVPTPHFQHADQYKGKVVDVRAGNARLDITAIAGPAPPSSSSPLIAFIGQHDERVLVLAVDHTDLSLRYFMPAVRATLEQPDLRLRGALRGVAPGDTFTAATWHDSTDICLRVNTTQRCGLGYTIGDGWKLIYYPESWAPWGLALINTLWLAGCVTGVGFWSVWRRKEGAAIGRIAIAIAILGSVMVPIATGLNATTLYEFLGVVGGIVFGRWLARRLLRGDYSENRSRQLNDIQLPARILPK